MSASGQPWTRLAFLAPAGIALLLGMASGLGRLGLDVGFGPLADHGPLMVLGFLGTLISLERAVAAAHRWGYVVPVLSGTGAIAVAVGAPLMLSSGVLIVAGLGLVTLTVRNLVIQPSLHLGVMTLGAAMWPLAAALWSRGAGPRDLVAPLAAFLVLTIVAERLELSRLGLPSRRERVPLLAGIVVLVVAATAAPVSFEASWLLAGTALLVQAAWLGRYDLARGTIHRRGLPRFVASCLLSGFGWLGVSGALWIWHALAPAAFTYDAAVHALFLGFVMAMVFGHAPIILPAVLRIDLPYQPIAYAPLVLLHLTLAARIGGDLLGSQWLRATGGVGNVIAVVAFIVVNVGLARPRPRAGAMARPTPPASSREPRDTAASPGAPRTR